MQAVKKKKKKKKKILFSSYFFAAHTGYTYNRVKFSIPVQSKTRDEGYNINTTPPLKRKVMKRNVLNEMYNNLCKIS